MPIVPIADYNTYLGLSDDATVSLLAKEVERAVSQYMDWDPVRADHLIYLPATERGGDGHGFVYNIGSIPNSGGITNILMLPHKYVRAACGHPAAVDSKITVWNNPGAYAGQASDFEEGHIMTRGSGYVLDFDWHHAAKSIDLSRTGHLRRLGGSWPRQRGSVKVVYTAGFSATEFTGALSAAGDAWDASDIRQACLLTMAAAYHTAQSTLGANTASGAAAGTLIGETIEGYSYTLDPSSTAAMSAMTVEVPPAAATKIHRYVRFGGVFG